jgi:hypothetical protein
VLTKKQPIPLKTKKQLTNCNVKSYALDSPAAEGIFIGKPMDSKERIYKLIEELQDMLASGWNVDAVSVWRGANSEGSKVFTFEVELSE